MPSEIELKFELSPDAVESLLNSAVLGEPEKTVDQVSTYFDTPEHMLFANGFTLRLRRTDKGLIQTVKAAPESGSPFARAEWEVPVREERPQLDHSNPLVNEFGSDLSVGPIFRVEVERRVWTLVEAGSEVEVALDQGDIISGERRALVRELELELKDGDPAALFSLARRLAGNAAFRFGILSKAERGFALTAAQMHVHKAQPVDLTRSQRASTAFQAIAASCFRQFRLNEDILLGRPNAEALHQARVALRRLRSAFNVFKPLLTGEQPPRLKEELKWLASVLGEARNLDVILGKDWDGASTEQLQNAREAAYAAATEALRSQRAMGLMLDLNEWLQCGDYLRDPATEELRAMPAPDFAEEALDRLRRRMKKHGKAMADADDRHRHEVRKDAKKLRYAAEFFGPLFNDKRAARRHKRFIAAMEQLQDHLGELNDLATRDHVLERHGLADAEERQGDKDDLIEQAQAALDDVIDLKRFWR